MEKKELQENNAAGKHGPATTPWHIELYSEGRAIEDQKAVFALERKHDQAGRLSPDDAGMIIRKRGWPGLEHIQDLVQHVQQGNANEQDTAELNAYLTFPKNNEHDNRGRDLLYKQFQATITDAEREELAKLREDQNKHEKISPVAETVKQCVPIDETVDTEYNRQILLPSNVTRKDAYRIGGERQQQALRIANGIDPYFTEAEADRIWSERTKQIHSLEPPADATDDQLATFEKQRARVSAGLDISLSDEDFGRISTDRQQQFDAITYGLPQFSSRKEIDDAVAANGQTVDEDWNWRNNLAPGTTYDQSAHMITQRYDVASDFVRYGLDPAMDPQEAKRIREKRMNRAATFMDMPQDTAEQIDERNRLIKAVRLGLPEDSRLDEIDRLEEVCNRHASAVELGLDMEATQQMIDAAKARKETGSPGIGACELQTH